MRARSILDWSQSNNIMFHDHHYKISTAIQARRKGVTGVSYPGPCDVWGPRRCSTI